MLVFFRCRLLMLLVLLLVGSAARAQSAPTLRGWGCIHILAEPGPLRIELSKWDLNNNVGADMLIARLVGPDRLPVAEAVIDDDGEAGRGRSGPVQRAVIETTIERAGLYKLDLECRTGDQSGSDIAWSAGISGGRYMYEGEPLFYALDGSADLCFMPPDEPFDITIRSLGVEQTVTLHDGEGNVVQALDVPKSGQHTMKVDPAGSKTGIWRLHIPRQRCGVTIQHVTTFTGPEEYYPDIGYWTDHPSAWFPIRDVRWTLTPGNHVTYRRPGDSCEVSLDLYNHSAAPVAYRIKIESSEGLDAEAMASATLDPGQTLAMPVRLKIADDVAPGDELWARITATHAEGEPYPTWSTILVRIGEAPATKPLDMPITAEPYQHENFQFGYEPDYVPNGMYFDHDNRPYVRHRTRHRHIVTAMETLVDGQWRHSPFIDAIRSVLPKFEATYFAAHAQPVKTAFDGHNVSYNMIGVRAGARHVVLLESGDQLQTYDAHIVASGSDVNYDIEQFTGHNDDTGGPPPLLIYRRRAPHEARWADYWDLLLYLPTRDVEGKLDLGEPIHVTDRCVGLASHSGGASALASVGSNIHVVWGETTDAGEEAPGVPTYIATYDRRTGTLGRKVLLSHGAPINDIHNSPGIVADSKGYLHVVSGAHGKPFMYARSLEANDAYRGWTDAEPVLTKGRINAGTDEDGEGGQTYLGLVCGQDDTLHVAYRQWRENVDERFGGRLYAALSYQSKKPGEPWSEARPLFVPPLPDYSVFYHKLSIDRLGRIFLQYSYYSVHKHYRTDLPGLLDYQTIIFSADQGKSWKLAETRDFMGGIKP